MLRSEIDTTALKLKYNKIPKIDGRPFSKAIQFAFNTSMNCSKNCIGSQLASMDCSMNCSKLYGLF